MSLFRRKRIADIMAEHEAGLNDHASGLHRTLGVRDLIFLGVAAVIGAGIFSTVGQAAYEGGPGVVFLFIITAITCGFTALCYAEFAGRVPVSGSAYTYSYVSFGEVVAWVIGWALILEYAIGNTVVAVSWSSYFDNIIRAFGIHLPAWLLTDPMTAQEQFLAWQESGASGTAPGAWATAPTLFGRRMILNLPAGLINVLVTALVYIGIRESKRVANAMVLVKLVILAAVVGVGLFHLDLANYTPFLPNGFGGVLRGVSAVFFAYIGFDAISTTAEECRDPQRDLPRGMIWALVICTVIYALVALVLTGMVPYTEFRHVADPLAFVFERIDMPRFGLVVSVSALVAATSVLLVFAIGQPRIWMTMSRDGLLPRRFGHLHRRFRTPAFATIVAGLLATLPSFWAPSGILTDLTSIGTLFAFTLVCAGVLVLPRPEATPGRFRMPHFDSRWLAPAAMAAFLWFNGPRLWQMLGRLGEIDLGAGLLLTYTVLAVVLVAVASAQRMSFIPVMGVLTSAYLMVEIPAKSWVVFFFWMATGLVIYFGYGRLHSKLAKATAQ
ncbi:MAG: amino acid permease [Flavobacteriales bacterium]|nr:amino acid permease [Flavobacteriales bacterium]